MRVNALLPAKLVAAVREAGRALPGAAAAFDADGTLWREDVGEAFLKHLIALGWVKCADGTDPYPIYEAKVAQDRAAGFAFAAQLQAGLSRAALEAEATKLAASWVAPRLIESTQALLALCRESGLVPTVVSASPIEIVRAAAPLAGVPVSRCLGMTVQAGEGGILTDAMAGPITYADGKVQALANASWLPIALACGDSNTGDLAMLKAARVAVGVAPKSGSALANECTARGWSLLLE